MRKNWLIILTGILIGLAAVLLSAFGNPGNMGFCIACFLRDVSGALKLHSASAVQYVRPEITGLILGSTIAALLFHEFKPRGGSSPMLRFVIAAFVMIGALVFLGCPLRMMIRIGGGDLNAVVGLVGFAAGIYVGVLWLKGGFSLNRAYALSPAEGSALPVLSVILLTAAIALPSLFAETEAGGGPGAMHAPLLLSLGCGLVVGGFAQRSRFCTVAGGRDAMLFQDFSMLLGFAAAIGTVLAGNLILGKLHFSFSNQPIAHTDGVWNFFSMALVGWGSVLLGGCPLRQLILAGEGNTDSAITVLGYVFGAAVSHNFALASSANGPARGGMLAVVAGFAVFTLICILQKRGGMKV